MNAQIMKAALNLAASPARQGYRLEALHEYTSAQGEPLFWVIRMNHPDPDKKKWIRPMIQTDEGFELRKGDFADGFPLYQLHDLSTRPNETVFLVEGEWCTNHLSKAGVLATTSGGADTARTTDWQPLAGRTVIIWPDNDEAGQRYATESAEKLQAIGCDVLIVDVDTLGLPEKGDAVDWLKENPDATPSDISALATLEPPQTAQKSESLPGPDSYPSRQEIIDRAVVQLAAFSRKEYECVRKSEAKRLDVRVSELDQWVMDERQTEPDTGFCRDDPEPWPTEIDPEQLLGEISSTVRRFIVCDDETAHAVALWVVMTWFIDVIQIAPLAVITAPEMRCGKSQLLALMGRLVRKPIPAANITPAALFRSIEAFEPTLLVDEADSFMNQNEELRGLLNSGHTRESAFILRVVGDNHEPKRFNTWGAKALAGIGKLAGTLMDRSITLKLRRKLPHEFVERLRHAEPRIFEELSAKLARFAEDYREQVRCARPDLPSSLNDRAQDNWEPLLAIADIAGGPWPDLSRAASLTLSDTDNDTVSIGTELLSDIKGVFETQRVERITTNDLIKALCEDDEKPWSTYKNDKPINPRQLAKLLKGYDIKSKGIRMGYRDTPKGYKRAEFEGAFSSYLSPSAPNNTRHTQQPSNDAASSVADSTPVAATQDLSATLKPAWDKGCGVVADKKGDTGGNIVEVEI